MWGVKKESSSAHHPPRARAAGSPFRTSNLLYKPLSALWLRPAHRDTLMLICEDTPGSRHAKKWNRSKKVFTAMGWLILPFLWQDILWDVSNWPSVAPNELHVTWKDRRPTCLGVVLEERQLRRLPHSPPQERNEDCLKIPSHFKSLFVWWKHKKNRQCPRDRCVLSEVDYCVISL